jgi:hypothetical protein
MKDLDVDYNTVNFIHHMYYAFLLDDIYLNRNTKKINRYYSFYSASKSSLDKSYSPIKKVLFNSWSLHLSAFLIGTNLRKTLIKFSVFMCRAFFSRFCSIFPYHCCAFKQDRMVSV